MRASDSFKIRPAGRHILTIGRDLIQDSYAAVVELVKNAYDADSPDVKIEFSARPENGGYKIVLSDHGHGMSRDTVINKWIVPSTDDKLQRRMSPAGRIMQGSKGIGRFATSVLGKDLLLETVSGGEKTTLFVLWKAFEDARFLDDVDVLIETIETSEPSGTRLTITGDDEYLVDWDKDQLDRLRYALKKLMSPVDSVLNDDSFGISLSVTGFSNVADLKESVEPFPIFDLFDYRIAGTVNSAGQGTLVYSLQKVRYADEEIVIDLHEPTGCGELSLDIRVYDREKDAIDALIQRGLKNESDNYVGKNEARRLLNLFNGIGVYRNGFRIGPFGDSQFDWLGLNHRRVQNPSLRLGSNQVIGYVQIQSEDQSRLIEKSARDGLKESRAFERLKGVTLKVIAELETRRFRYRRKAGLSRSVQRVERQLDRLFSYDEMKGAVQTELSSSPIGQSEVNEILAIIDREAEEKNKVVEEIRQTVAIYQGQATLGKIIDVILHEGRQPLNYFRSQIPNLKYWYEAFQESGDPAKLSKAAPIASGIGQNAELFVQLFERLDPLATRKRSAKKPLSLKKTLVDILSVFESEMTTRNVTAEVRGPDDLRFLCWSQDIYSIFTNLIDNSLYWITEKNICRREIAIDIKRQGDSSFCVDYRDTGPGIDPDDIEEEQIFEPHFTTRPDGIGLGLAIAGEAADRSGLELKAFQSEEGAWFRIEPVTEGKE